MYEIQRIISALQKWVFNGKSTPAVSSHFGIQVSSMLKVKMLSYWTSVGVYGFFRSLLILTVLFLLLSPPY